MAGKVVHCRKESYDILVSRPSIYGNIFTHLPVNKTLAVFTVLNRHEAVRCYRAWLLNEGWVFTMFPDLEKEEFKAMRQAILNDLPSLKNKVLACWCAPLECHGDVLLELANQS